MFHIGQRVVCVDAKSHNAGQRVKSYEDGKIYTVTDNMGGLKEGNTYTICEIGALCWISGIYNGVRLEEIERDNPLWGLCLPVSARCLKRKMRLVLRKLLDPANHKHLEGV